MSLMSIRGVILTAAAALLAPGALLPLHAQEETPTGAPGTAEAPSAELIIDAEEAVISEPSLAPGEEPLPPMDAPFPGEDNIFGNDLFGMPDTYSPPPAMPERPPLLEDPQESERKMRVQLRKLKAVLDREPQLFELQEMADQATTPEDRRAARRAYYALFFDKVRKADPKLADYADRLEKASLKNLYQTRIEPTLALNPPPQPQPQVQFIPKRQFEDYMPADEEPVRLP